MTEDEEIYWEDRKKKLKEVGLFHLEKTEQVQMEGNHIPITLTKIKAVTKKMDEYLHKDS